MFEVLVLSLIQGLTEFLPVSSSGHLILLPSLIGWQDHSLEIDGILHLGTLCSVVCYFFSEIKQMVLGFLLYYLKIGPKEGRSSHSAYAKLGMTLIVATLPVVIIGFVLKRVGLDVVRSPSINALMLSMGGMALYGADRISTSHRSLLDMTFTRAFAIGLLQSVSLVPGSSRSGMCLTAARFLGFDRVSATQYAFLLSIPAILGAFTLIFFDAYHDGIQMSYSTLGAYFCLSFLFGLGAIHFMLKFVQHKNSFFIFMIYRIVLGGAIFLLM